MCFIAQVFNPSGELGLGDLTWGQVGYLDGGIVEECVDFRVLIVEVRKMTAKELLERYAAGERDFSGVDFSGTKFKIFSYIFNGINLERANLEGAYLEGVQLERANLAGSILRNVDFEVDLTDANLEGANLEGANLQESCLERANLRRANLERASFYMVNLENANLEGANLKYVTFEDACVNGANFRNAIMEGCSGCVYDYSLAIMPDGKILPMIPEGCYIGQPGFPNWP